MNMLKSANIAGGNSKRGRVENDFYATHPDSTLALLQHEEILYPYLEPACGAGHISKLLKGNGISTDIVNRGFGARFVDYLDESYDHVVFGLEYIQTVITNPPFSHFEDFVKKSLSLPNVKKIIMFGKLQALEGQKRATFLEGTPLRTVYVFKKRQQPMRNGSEFDESGKRLSSTMAFAWFVWEVGYEGRPEIKWI